MPDPKLRECPKCRQHNLLFGRGMTIECSCGITFAIDNDCFSGRASTVDDLVRAWNTRPTPSAWVAVGDLPERWRKVAEAFDRYALTSTAEPERRWNAGNASATQQCRDDLLRALATTPPSAPKGDKEQC